MTIPKICIKCDNFQTTSGEQNVTFGTSLSRLRCRHGAEQEAKARITGTCMFLNNKTIKAKSKTILRQIGISGEAPKQTVDIQQEILETLMAIDDKLRVLVGRP